MAVCLLKSKVEQFKKDIKNKKISLADLVLMDSKKRTSLLEKYAGKENAQAVNTLIEQKLVLKNKLLGIINAVSKLGEIGRYDPTKKAEIAEALSEFRAKQQERIFSPQKGETFLNDLADKILGTHVTKEEAKYVFKLTENVAKNKEAYNEKTETWTSFIARIKYGASKVILENYTKELKGEGLPIRIMLRERKAEFMKDLSENKARALFKLSMDTLKVISDNSIAFVASVDNSFLGRQGLKTLQTHPTIWWRGAKNSFIDIAKTFKGQETIDALMADVYSRPNYMNGNFQKAKLIPKSEEQYPTTLPERIWGVGVVFKASESAFTGSAIRMRTDLYDMLSNMAKENKVDVNSDIFIKDLGKLTSSLTARGQLGQTGSSPIVRMTLWAPKMLKANWDVLTGHTLGAGLETSFVKKQAALNILKIASETALIMAIIGAMWPDAIEEDPRSSDFGKIKIGNTRFDLTGGMASLITLSSRMLPFIGGTKSTTTKKVTKYGSGFGENSRWDALLNFLENKTTPFAGALIDVLKGEDFEGRKPTLASTAFGLTTPISIQNAIELKDDASADAVVGVLADFVGISTSTYKAKVDWEVNTGKELLQFKEEIGDKKFKEANDKFNKLYPEKLDAITKKDDYKKLSSDDKKKVITKLKSSIKDDIFDDYDFKYKAEKKTDEDEDIADIIEELTE